MSSTSKLRRGNSGQLLLVAALGIALLISSTAVYVYDLAKEQDTGNAQPSADFILALKLGTQNTIISSLANCSNGGPALVLVSNLDELSQAFLCLRQFGTLYQTYSLSNESLYGSGVRFSWDTSDIGVSSACANFTLRTLGSPTNLALSYAVNITTAAEAHGLYTLSGSQKHVNLTCRLYNEGEPALARDMTLFYNNQGNWTQLTDLNSISLFDYGNGTYTFSFVVAVPSSGVQVSAHVHDTRGIFVQVNTTCYDASVEVSMPGDVNADGIVNILDIMTAARSFGSSLGDLNWDSAADANGDGKIDLKDYIIIAENFGNTYP